MAIKLTKISQRRHLTGWSWLFILILIVMLLILFSRHIHPFLALNKPVKADIWVVEGHVGDIVIDSVVYNYQQGNCTILFTTGIPIEQQLFCDHYSNYADLSAASLISRGVDYLHVYSAPCNPIQVDRSYASALALKAKLEEYGFTTGNINIVSQDTHARRTYTLFKKVLGKEWNVGSISYFDFSYNPEKWWKSSYGMRAVIYECLAYIYTVFFFHPEK